MPRLPGQVYQYRLYCDESGDHTFQKSNIDNHRYLGLLGVWFEQQTCYREFYERLEAFKQNIFGRRDPDDDSICLHRKDIIERKGVFGRLCNAELNRRFQDGLLELIAGGRYRMTGVVLDKNTHETKTYRELFHPYHYCLATLLERYAGWLEWVGDRGDVMAESRAKSEDRLLSKAFEDVYSGGTRVHNADRFQKVLTSKKLKFKGKEHNIAGLQLADLLAYPFRREMILEHRDEPIPKDFSAELLDAARRKMNRHIYRGTVSGYGKVWLT
jgi:Protein of unknown function (DUF3800)